MPGKHGQQDLSAARAAPRKIPNPLRNTSLSDLARLSLSRLANQRAWESPSGSTGSGRRLGRAWPADRSRGEPPMENTLLVGLSRQMTLERQMDVVANNVANVNTTGFKADRSLFEEYLQLARARRQFRRAPTAASRFVQDRATFHDFAPGPIRADQEPARRRDRRRRLPRGADAGRRALHPRRRPADQQPGPARHRRRQSGARQLRPDRVPADRQARSTSPPTATSPCSRAPAASTRCAASCGWSSFADAQKLVKEGSNLYSAGQGVAAAARHHLAGAPGLHREVERQFGRPR